MIYKDLDTRDEFQERYEKHQEHKKEQLKSAYEGDAPYKLPANTILVYGDILSARRSQRLFNGVPISNDTIKHLFTFLKETPSSCNRQAIAVKIVETRDEKELLGGLLVGGVGWCHRADKLILIFAHKAAYKEDFAPMPYLDAGAFVMSAYMAATALNLGCAYINPNIRADNLAYFDQRFGGDGLIYCGAMALGYYDIKARKTPKEDIKML